MTSEAANQAPRPFKTPFLEWPDTVRETVYKAVFDQIVPSDHIWLPLARTANDAVLCTHPGFMANSNCEQRW